MRDWFSHQMSEINIYTDGSAPTNVAGVNNRAGWAFVVVKGDTGPQHNEGEKTYESNGRVITDPHHPLWIGAEVGSNNTAELSAMYHALDYIRTMSLEDVTIYTDSMYAMNLVFGTWKPSTNHRLVNSAKELAERLKGKVTCIHVRAHMDLLWNETADELAKQGALM